jgi:hypothetical protein
MAQEGQLAPLSSGFCAVGGPLRAPAPDHLRLHSPLDGQGSVGAGSKVCRPVEAVRFLHFFAFNAWAFSAT